MLAPTQITGKLGKGGMGVVYLAGGTKFNRHAAIKVLPGAMDSDQLTRFTRKDRAIVM